MKWGFEDILYPLFLQIVEPFGVGEQVDFDRL